MTEFRNDGDAATIAQNNTDAWQSFYGGVDPVRHAAQLKFLADNPDPIVYALNWNRAHGRPAADYDRPDYAFSPEAARLRDARIADVPTVLAEGTPVTVINGYPLTRDDYQGRIVWHDTRRDGRSVYGVRDRYGVVRAHVDTEIRPA